MIALVLSSIMFNLMSPPPGYNQMYEDTELEESVDTETKIIDNKEEQIEEEAYKKELCDKNMKPIEHKDASADATDDNEATEEEVVARVESDSIDIKSDDNVQEVGSFNADAKDANNDNQSPNDDLVTTTAAILNEIDPEDSKEDSKVIKEESYHYYLYFCDYCPYCGLQLTELEAHVEPHNIDVIENARFTNSGKKIVAYPTLEVYKGKECIYYGIGYISWNSLIKIIDNEVR